MTQNADTRGPDQACREANGRPGVIGLCVRRDVVLRSIRYGLIVGTVLVAINHGDALLRLDVSLDRLLRILLTYCVPYAVTTTASVQAIRHERG